MKILLLKYSSKFTSRIYYTAKNNLDAEILLDYLPSLPVPIPRRDECIDATKRSRDGNKASQIS
jgi:hypothetical protein